LRKLKIFLKIKKDKIVKCFTNLVPSRTHPYLVATVVSVVMVPLLYAVAYGLGCVISPFLPYNMSHPEDKIFGGCVVIFITFVAFVFAVSFSDWVNPDWEEAGRIYDKKCNEYNRKKNECQDRIGKPW